MIRDDAILDCAIDLVVVAGMADEILAAWERHDLETLRSREGAHRVIEFPTRVHVADLFFLPEAISANLAHVGLERRSCYVDGPHAIWEACLVQPAWVQIISAVGFDTLERVSSTWATILSEGREPDERYREVDFLRALVGLCRQADQDSLDVVIFEKHGRV